MFKPCVVFTGSQEAELPGRALRGAAEGAGGVRDQFPRAAHHGAGLRQRADRPAPRRHRRPAVLHGLRAEALRPAHSRRQPRKGGAFSFCSDPTLVDNLQKVLLLVFVPNPLSSTTSKRWLLLCFVNFEGAVFISSSFK